MTELASLFHDSQLPTVPTSDRPLGPFAGVALEQGIDRVLDYAIPPRLATGLQVGQRVRVPLGRGNTAAYGYVVSIQPTSEFPKIKNLLGIDDDRVLVTPGLLTLARWIAKYYGAPLGIVLEAVIPSAVKKRIGLGYNQMVYLAKSKEEIQAVLEKARTPKRRAILATLLQLEDGSGIEMVRLAGEAGVAIGTVRRLSHLGHITIRSEVDLPGLTADIVGGLADESPLPLNEDQQKAFEDMNRRIGPEAGFSVNLLHGVTGSGKTELYLQWISQVVAGGKQALVLVPEIALTPQTVARFRSRFKRVAVLHSGLSATQRHKFWQQIRQGNADVVVGARSAVFAPMENLGIIVVDEEHDSSYKADQIPRYHGRDVAIKRAQIENIPVVLGSATPSLEMYWRAKSESGKSNSLYHYLSLPRRVRGLAMPTVEMVDMRAERSQRRGVRLISKRLENLLRQTIEAKQQAILLLNRRGYANYIFCPSCSETIQCKYCDATMTYHRSADAHVHSGSFSAGLHTGQLHCHYCLAVNKLPEKCPNCSKKLTLFGLGTQRVEEELQQLFPQLKFARVDGDAMKSAKDYEALLAKFATGEIQALLGTQMISKGLDYPNVTLVGVISGDTALSLPDFRAAERTFQLITQVSGRAGRGDAPGRVVVQTFMPGDPTIQAALKQDYEGFANSELANRKNVGLPPFTRQARIIVRHQDKDKLMAICAKLAEQIAAAIAQTQSPVNMRGPMPCIIGRIAGYFRHQIELRAARPEPIQAVLAHARAAGAIAKANTIAVDVDPVSLL